MVEWFRRWIANSARWVRFLLSPQLPRGQVTIDGSYPTIEWLDTISRYEQHSVYMFESGRNLNIYLPRWRNGSVFVLHTNGGGSIPSRGTIKWLTLHNGLQRKCIWVVKVVRIRQPDCKSGPFGSGSSPLLPTMIMSFSKRKGVDTFLGSRKFKPSAGAP